MAHTFDPLLEPEPRELETKEQAWKRKAISLARMSRGQRNRAERRAGKPETGHLFPLTLRPGNVDPFQMHSAEEFGAYLEAHPEYVTRRIHLGAPWGLNGKPVDAGCHLVEMSPNGAALLAELVVAMGLTPSQVVALAAGKALAALKREVEGKAHE